MQKPHKTRGREPRKENEKKKRPFLPPAQTKKVRARREPLPATRQSALRSEDDSFSLLPTNSLEDRGGAGSSAAGSVVSQVRVPSAARFPSSAVPSPSLVYFPTREPLTLRPLLMVGSILPLLPPLAAAAAAKEEVARRAALDDRARATRPHATPLLPAPRRRRGRT